MFKFNNGNLDVSPKKKDSRIERCIFGHMVMKVFMIVTAVLVFNGAAVIRASDLLVSSSVNNKVLLYDGESGDFIDIFIQGSFNELNGPTGLSFGPVTCPPIIGP